MKRKAFVVQKVQRVNFLSRVTCPHCWQKFAPEDIMWLSASPELLGDLKLGADAQQRFLPTRFSVSGNALDVHGTECQELACPNCHLVIPRTLLSLRSFYVSIAGTPSCGKSYFLASMTWQLRHSVPERFGCTFGDADPTFNKLLNDYEEQQFFNPNQDGIVKLAKTQEYGDHYSVVQLGSQSYSFPQPFLFAIRPGVDHPSFATSKRASRAICLYDNAGESYQAGKDTVTNQVTRHLAVADCFMFCFDPTQDPRFRNAAKSGSADYQMTESPVTARQETVLYELIQRVRRHTSLGESEQTKKPLMILCTKFDAWSSLLGVDRIAPPVISSVDSSLSSLDMREVKRVSTQVRCLIAKYSPELVGSSEAFSENVMYLPVSATGVAPEKCGNGVIGVRPKDMNPMWCDVPMLVALSQWCGGLIPYRT